MQYYELFIILMTPICLNYSYNKLYFSKKVKIEGKPRVYFIKSFKNLNLWYTETDFFNFKMDYLNNNF